MALKKKMRMDNGLELEYHKISLININPNQEITILLDSYLDSEARQYEKDYAAGLIQDPVFPYLHSEYYHFEYSYIEALVGDTMRGAYELIKTTKSELADAEEI